MFTIAALVTLPILNQAYAPSDWNIVGPWEGSYYLKVDRKVTWPEAQWEARQIWVKISGKWCQGSLATVSSAEENQAIWNLTQSPKWCWFDATWKWNPSWGEWAWATSDDLRISYFNWATNRKSWNSSSSAFASYDESNGSWTANGWMKRPGFVVEFRP